MKRATKKQAVSNRRKRGPVRARCFVLRADRNGRVWYVADGGGSTTLTNFAREFATLAEARLAKVAIIWPEWRIWRRGRR